MDLYGLTDELKKACQEGHTIESMPKNRKMEPVGEVKGSRGFIYQFYKDDVGEYWFEIYVKRDGKLVKLGESIFEKRRRRR